MVTRNQLTKKKRKGKRNFCIAPMLERNPQKRGVCRRVTTMKPKKPNSSTRKIAKVELSNRKKVTLAIPGQGHSLQEYSVVLVRGCRVRDLPGVHYKAIRGKYDFTMAERFVRRRRCSKFGIKTKGNR